MPNQVQVVAPDVEYLIEIAQRLHRPSGMSFTAGLLLGQLSVVLLVIVCFKYLLLEDVRYGRKVKKRGPRVLPSSMLIRTHSNERSMGYDNANTLKDIVCFLKKKPRSFSNRGIAIPAPPTKPSLPSTTTILNKTLYDVYDHTPESLDWMSVLMAQAIAQYRDDSKVNNRLIKALAEALNGGVRPDWVVRREIHG